MSMEKVGVVDATAQQKQELESINNRLGYLGASLEKTAEDRSEIKRLESRRKELNSAINDQ